MANQEDYGGEVGHTSRQAPDGIQQISLDPSPEWLVGKSAAEPVEELTQSEPVVIL